MKAKIFTNKGQVKEDINLPKEFDVTLNQSILDQSVRVLEDNTHFGLNKVKTRSEVNITKKKIYRQKGTGGARHGAKSAHIFVGGGVSHGPTGLKRKLNLNTKMKQNAKKVALALAVKLNKVVFVEGLDKLAKTNEVGKLINVIKTELKKNSKVTLVLSSENMSLRRFARNIKDLVVVDFNTLNAFNIMSANLIIMDDKIVASKKEVIKKEVKSKTSTKSSVSKKVTKK